MKKIFTQILLTSAFVSAVFVAQAQNLGTSSQAEAVGTGNTPGVSMPATQAVLDHQFTYDVSAAVGGGVGNAGVVNIGTQFWVSKWQTDTIWILDNAGAMVSSFNIPLGVGGGIRAMTTNGLSVYAAQNGNEILVIDIGSMSVSGTIPVPAAGFAIRSVTYDPTANSGAGGFWVSNFGTDILQISMTGAILNTIPAASHGLAGMYGTAFDNVTSLTANSLWVFDQPANPGATLWQIDIASGMQTGATLDVNASLGYAALAGGVCVATGIQAQPSLCALVQQTPNSIEGFELTLPVGLNEAGADQNISVFPIPATDHIDFVLYNMKSSSLNVEVYDIQGNLVTSFVSTDKKITVVTNTFASGVYTAKIADGSTMYAKKFIVR